MDTPQPDLTNPEADSSSTIDWLIDHAMLSRGRQIAAGYSANGAQWRRPYAVEQPRAAAAIASAWLTVYPSSIMTRPGESVLRYAGR